MYVSANEDRQSGRFKDKFGPMWLADWLIVYFVYDVVFTQLELVRKRGSTEDALRFVSPLLLPSLLSFLQFFPHAELYLFS